MTELEKNIAVVEQNIEDAASRSGRKREDITLIAVTKTIDVVRINEALRCGLSVIGENRVQEFLEKEQQLLPCKRHIIGHLQTNKVKYVVGKVDMIESVDSFRLAQEIAKKSAEADCTTDVLLEVNAGGEESKFGLTIEETPDIIEKIELLTNIRVQGLMTVAPFSSNPEDVRIVFRKMKQLFLDIGANRYNNSSMNYLSMGMSNDYQIAIEEGANMVRLGSAIFGKRMYA